MADNPRSNPALSTNYSGRHWPDLSFRWLALLCVICIPSIIFFKKVQSRGTAVAAH